LAQLELKALGVKFEVTNGLREFKLLKEPKTLSNFFIASSKVISSIFSILTIFPTSYLKQSMEAAVWEVIKH